MDADGNNDPGSWAWWVDSAGTIWEGYQGTSGIRAFPCQGLDSAGNPIYSRASSVLYSTPALFNDVERVVYIPATDTMYITGFTSANPNTNGSWGVIGTVLARYNNNNWSTSPTLAWSIVLPWNWSASPEIFAKAVAVAGDWVFVQMCKQAQVYVYNATTGASLGSMTPPATYDAGWVDIPYGISAYQKSSGEYNVFVEEDAKAKIILYQLSGSAPSSSSTIYEAEAAGNTVGGGAQIQPQVVKPH